MPFNIPPTAELTPDEIRRYARHILLPEVGQEGQQRLKSASVLVVGMGGLGSPVALYLAAAGVGHLGLIDDDVVDESNLQRQVLYTTAEVGQPKAVAARERLHGLNPHVQIDAHVDRLTPANAWEIIGQYDLIVDGTDNFATRYLINDTAVLQKKPFVYGSISRFEGQVSVFYAEAGPCYRCIFPQPPARYQTCAELGVLGALPGVIGTLEATETLKLILGIGKPLIGRLLLYDALAMQFDIIRLRKNPACKVCGEHPEITKIAADYEKTVCTQTSEETDLPPDANLSPEALAEQLEKGKAPLIIDVRSPEEFALGHLPGAHNIPLERLDAHLVHLSQDRDIVTVCRRGRRSAIATKQLLEAGFRKAKRLQGGLEAWQQSIDAAFPL